MKKLCAAMMMICFVIALGFTTVQAAPSAKVTAVAGQLRSVSTGEGYVTIMKNTIKTASMKDLFIDVSAECGLTTNTKVASKFLEKAIATAEAKVKVKVLVDGGAVPVVPAEVTFARRAQTLIAEFAGSLAYYDESGNFVNCITLEIDPNTGLPTGATIIDPDCVEEETLALILDTMEANSFNFIAADVPVGSHTIEVQAMIEYSATSEDTETLIDDSPVPITKAYLGNGSFTVEEVRMVKDESIEPEI